MACQGRAGKSSCSPAGRKGWSWVRMSSTTTGSAPQERASRYSRWPVAEPQEKVGLRPASESALEPPKRQDARERAEEIALAPPNPRAAKQALPWEPSPVHLDLRFLPLRKRSRAVHPQPTLRNLATSPSRMSAREAWTFAFGLVFGRDTESRRRPVSPMPDHWVQAVRPQGAFPSCSFVMLRGEVDKGRGLW